MLTIDFDRFPILLDWLVSITIDYNRFLSSIEIIDLLRPDYIMLKRNCTQSQWRDQDWKVTNLVEVMSLILRRTLNEIVSVFWSSRKLFAAFLLR